MRRVGGEEARQGGGGEGRTEERGMGEGGGWRTEGCEKLTYGCSTAKRFQSLNQININGVVVPFFFHISYHLFYFVNDLFLWLFFFSLFASL